MVSLREFNTLGSTPESSNKIGVFHSMLAGIGSGLIAIPKGLFSLGASLMDLGANTGKAAEVEKWFDDLRSDEREEAYPGEKSLYLKDLVDENVFNCEGACKQALEKTISEEEALQAGITFEKDFMLFLSFKYIHNLSH